ncbi:MAG: DJ-1/PfpI family protein [Eubacterium sp.]|nr:DJ-1/PfpI family protein [Eubacterium sp.]
MVFLFLAEGFEIIEALAPVDMLRRAKLDIKTVGVTCKTVTSSCGVAVNADITADEFVYENVDAIILPGGMPGTLNLENNQVVQSAIDKAVSNNALICAICAAPSILGHKGLLKGKNAIAFPGFEKDLDGAEISSEHVTVDGNFITAKGAGVAAEFGLKIVEMLTDKATADNIKETIQCR